MGGTNINLPGVSLSASALTVATMQVTGLTAGFVTSDGAGNLSVTATSAEVPSTRLINTTAPLTGGGDLSADRTIAITLATPSVSVQSDAGSASGGSATSVLRSDAGLLATTATPIALSATAPSRGTSTSLARADHDHGVQGLLQTLAFTIGTTATASSTTALTTSHRVLGVFVKITTGYSAGATLDVGQSGHTTDYINHAAAGVPAAFADLSKASVGDVLIVWGDAAVAAAAAVLASIGGSPSTGAARVTVLYTEPNA